MDYASATRVEQANRHIEVVDGIVKEVEVSWEI